GYALAAALLLGTAAMALRAALDRGSGTRRDGAVATVALRPGGTLVCGAVGGFVVGVTSIGAGSLMIVMLMFLYPAMATRRLVGTDLTQAIPLAGAAALGALAFGHVVLVVTAAVVIGGAPGALLGALVSSRVPDRYLRPLIVVAVLASGLKYAGVPTTALFFCLVAVVAGAAVIWATTARPETRLGPGSGEDAGEGGARLRVQGDMHD
ncbi:MAG: sulfite exporter TauE/SafE family protein, partial [Acidimicrobiales bacterium]